jgi:multimeric flavodoxin WrbA
MTMILALLGSPRAKGNNSLLMEEALRGAASFGNIEVRKIMLNEMAIKPCQYCDGCLHTGRCVIRDDMDIIYQSILTMDAFLLAGPIYFSGLSAQVKLMIDRCQPFWAAKYAMKSDFFAGRKRPGMLILTGGQPAYNSQFAGSRHTVNLLYKMIGVQSIGSLEVPDIDARPADNRPAELVRAFAFGEQLISPGSMK